MGFPLAVGDYAGVMGGWNEPGWAFTWQHWLDPQPLEEETVWTGLIAKGGHFNVVGSKVFKFTDVRIAMATDGLSHTFMFGEKAVNYKNYQLRSADGFPYWEAWGQFAGADWATMRMFGTTRAMDNTTVGPNPEVPVMPDTKDRTGWMWVNAKQTQEFGFGSAHPLAFNVVQGDGSTRSVSFTTDLALLNRLGHRADGSAFNRLSEFE
jgi:hypothetical protein